MEVTRPALNSGAEWRDLNINEEVRVKLTDLGREMHKKHHDELRARFPSIGEYRPPKEDEDGWHRIQLWCLMQDYGSAISIGSNQPFETTIQVCAPIRDTTRTK